MRNRYANHTREERLSMQCKTALINFNPSHKISCSVYEKKKIERIYEDLIESRSCLMMMKDGCSAKEL